MGVFQTQKRTASNLPLIVLHFASGLIVLSYLISFIAPSETYNYQPWTPHSYHSRPLPHCSTSCSGQTTSEIPSSASSQPADSTRPLTSVFSEMPILESLTPPNSTLNDTDIWAPLTRGIDGFLYIEKNNTSHPGETEPWGISMFHGLHCLQLIRSELISWMHPANDTAGGHDHMHYQHGGRNETVKRHSGHLGHCFAYIAESLSCSADTTLELPHFFRHKDGDIEISIDGKDVLHRCSNPARAVEVAQKSEQTPIGDWIREAWFEGARVEDLFP